MRFLLQIHLSVFLIPALIPLSDVSTSKERRRSQLPVNKVKQLSSMADVEGLLAASAGRPVLIFKHSTACGLSAMAHEQFVSYLSTAEAGEVEHGLVRVIEERPVSQALAGAVGVVHQSPQALLIRNGKAVWNASHSAITAGALREAVRALSEAGPSDRGVRR
jgi:bacillithiol system protein YtxJ